MSTGLRSALIHVDVASLAMSASGSITGIVSVRNESHSFPSDGWSDFPVVILGWWLGPVNRVIEGKARSWECRFMDGPATIKLSQQDGDSWSMAWIDNGHVEFEAVISCRSFVQSLMAAASEVLIECGKRGWKNRDIDSLADDLKRAKSGAM